MLKGKLKKLEAFWSTLGEDDTDVMLKIKIGNVWCEYPYGLNKRLQEAIYHQTTLYFDIDPFDNKRYELRDYAISLPKAFFSNVKPVIINNLKKGDLIKVYQNDEEIFVGYFIEISDSKYYRCTPAIKQLNSMCNSIHKFKISDVEVKKVKDIIFADEDKEDFLLN